MPTLTQEDVCTFDELSELRKGNGEGLEEEYDYRLSDENIDERIGHGEYQFDAETGKVV